MKREFASVSRLKAVQFDEMMGEFGTSDDYVWLYKAPSAIMHGDPEGLRRLIEVQPDGQQKPVIEFPLTEVNAMLVDAGTNSLMFCRNFIQRFKPSDIVALERSERLNRRFLELVLKHPSGRDADELEAIKTELGSGTP